MSEELYLTGAVIANGIPDSDNDTLDSVEIRTIFTKYTKHLSDIQHDAIDYDGVDVLANWISESETTIKGNTIPEKSWMATLKVSDPETITAINKGELTCFSLGSVSSTAKTREAWFINKRISYHDLRSIEDVVPLRISIVDEGANGLPFEIVDYKTYINKRSDDEMTEDNKFSLSDIKNIFKFKQEITDEVAINKAEDNNEPVDSTEKNIDALFEKVDYLIEKIDAIEAALNNTVEKAEENEDEPKKEEEEEDEEKIEKEESESTKEEEDDNEEKIEKESETVIEKSTVKPHDIPKTTEKTSNFFTRTGRDALGRKIHK